MKTFFFLLTIGVLIFSCKSTKKISNEPLKQNTSISTENDGSSFEKAIVIKEKNETAGVHAEYEWLKENYPGYRTKGQSLSDYKGRPFDIITIITADGFEKSIYFDISNFFGKF